MGGNRSRSFFSLALPALSLEFPMHPKTLFRMFPQPRLEHLMEALAIDHQIVIFVMRPLDRYLIAINAAIPAVRRTNGNNREYVRPTLCSKLCKDTVG